MGMNIDCYFDLRIGEEKDTTNAQGATYGTFLERDQALEILAEEKESEDPFFMYLAWQASHTPNEAPSMYRQLYPDAKHEDRNYCQAQTTALDGAVGEVVAYLKTNDMWDDTLLVFSSDNGGQFNRHDNFPLRGFKNTSFEGGIRVPGFVTGGYLSDDRKGQEAKDFIVSVVDWYPTLLSAAGIDVGYHRSQSLYQSDEEDTRFDDNGVGDVPLDGRDLWDAIQFNKVSDEISVQSRELLLDLDYTETCLFSSCGAIRSGRWKFIRGAVMGVNESITNGTQWLSDFSTCEAEEDALGCASSEVSDNSLYCHLEETGCLFNMDLDACEKQNVGDQYPEVRANLIDRLDYYQAKSAPILIIAGSGMDIEDFDPGEKGDDFWGPYREYEEVTFEEELTEFYQEMYPDSIVGEDSAEREDDHFGAQEPNREEPKRDEAERPEDSHYGNGAAKGYEPEIPEMPEHEGHGVEEMEMNTLGKSTAGTSSVGRQEVVSKLVLAVLSIGLVVMLYFVGRYCYSSKLKQSTMDNEVAPLLPNKVTV